MPLSLFSSLAVGFRILLLTALMVAPLAAVSLANGTSLGIGKQGAGLVLFVTLQRQAMI